MAKRRGKQITPRDIADWFLRNDDYDVITNAEVEDGELEVAIYIDEDTGRLVVDVEVPETDEGEEETAAESFDHFWNFLGIEPTEERK